MTRSNQYGQPIGEPVEWSGAATPEPVRLVGRYVTLEPVSAHHADDLFEALCRPDDAALWTYRSDDRPVDVGALVERLAEWQTSGDSVTFAVVPGDTDRAAGVASLMRIDRVQGAIEVGAVVYARSLQRTRAATEAIRLLAGYVFDDLGYRRLEWKLDSLNQPSAAAARRLGFTEEGTFRNAVVYKGRNRDTLWFSIIDSEWPRVRGRLEAWLDPTNFDEAGRQRTRLSDL